MVDEHSIHSPFFFDFYNKVIKEINIDNKEFSDYEDIRQKLLMNTTEVAMIDLGAKSAYFDNDNRTLSKIAASSLSPAPYCRLYQRIAAYIEASQILELGTSMGITTLYLAHDHHTNVTTFEGNSPMINVALTHFEYFDKKNINLIEGNIDTTLAEFLLKPTKIHLALMDANHRYEPTIRYFNLISRRMADKGVIIVDDIYYSEDMKRAWQELRKHQLVYGSADLFRCGLLFFDPALNRQHYSWSM